MKDQPTKSGKPSAKKPAPAKRSAKKASAKRKTKPAAKDEGGEIVKRTGGTPAFVPTEKQREEVRTYAKTFPIHAEHHIATLLKISRSTLKKHFQPDLDLGRAQMLAAVGAQMINRALNANSANAKGDIDAQKFILARMGGWTTKIDLTAGGEGGPRFEIDLSGMSAAALREYGRQAAIQRGLDPDEICGPPIDD